MHFFQLNSGPGPIKVHLLIVSALDRMEIMGVFCTCSDRSRTRPCAIDPIKYGLSR